jgi:hypothetical protein
MGIQIGKSSGKGKRKSQKATWERPKRGKAFLSPKMIFATRPPASGVVATIILLRSAGPLSILLIYT